MRKTSAFFKFRIGVGFPAVVVLPPSYFGFPAVLVEPVPLPSVYSLIGRFVLWLSRSPVSEAGVADRQPLKNKAKMINVKSLFFIFFYP